jgi:hypothetical protein
VIVRYMWSAAFAALALGGCAQLLGLEPTTSPDAPIDAPRLVDAQACVGGDYRTVDPATGTCYVLFTTPMTRDAARTACRGLGATTRLAGIQSAAEASLLIRLIGTNDALIGGSDETTEGTFVWEDGSPVVLTSWNTGEPNSAVGMFEEDCIVMIGSIGGLWNDVPCAPPPPPSTLGTYPFVCERN